jgi:hypothetical protein
MRLARDSRSGACRQKRHQRPIVINNVGGDGKPNGKLSLQKHFHRAEH